MNTQIKENPSKELIIDLGLNDKAIDKLEKLYLPLKLSGIDDKDGYLKIVEYRKNVKAHRVAVEKAHKKEKAFYLENGRKVDAEKNRLLARLSPIENHLIEQENIVKKEKERVQAEEERQRQEKHDNRVKQVIAAGAVFNGQGYVWGNEGQEEIIDDSRIWLFPATGTEWPNFIFKIEEWKKNKDAMEAAEAQKLKQVEEAAEAERKAERKAEAERQSKIAEEQKAKQAELDKIAEKQAQQARNIKEAQDKIDEEKRKQAEAKRIQEAEERAKIEAEKKAAEDKKRHEKEIEAAKIKAIEDEKRHKIELEEATKKAAADAKAEEERKAKEKLETEKKKKAAVEKKARLLPDKEKLIAFRNSLSDIQLPEVSSGEANAILTDVNGKFTEILELIDRESEKL